MADLIRTLVERVRDEEGQGLAEYSLVIAFVAVACVLAVTALGVATLGLFNGILAGF